MKTIIPLLVAVMLTLPAFAQDVEKPALPISERTKKVTYEEVVTVSGADMKELYARSHNWFNTFYKSPSTVIKEASEANGTIVGKHSINIYKYIQEKKKDPPKKHQAGLVKYSITIMVKEGRYKYTITEIFKHQSPKLPIEKWMDENDAHKADNYAYLAQIDEFMKKLTEDLKAAMSKPSGDAAGDDW